MCPVGSLQLNIKLQDVVGLLQVNIELLGALELNIKLRNVSSGLIGVEY